MKERKVRCPLSHVFPSPHDCICLLPVPPARLSRIVSFTKSGAKQVCLWPLELCTCMHNTQAYWL